MNSKLLLILIGLVVLAGVAYGLLSVSNDDTMMVKETMTDTQLVNEAAMSEKQADLMDENTQTEEVMMKDDKSEEMVGDEMMKKSGSYEMYSADKLVMAETGKVVLFFKASWCPTCRALDAAIKNSLGDIPSDVTILEIDYDDSTELKQKYGVTSQHTLVQVDASGTELAQWSGGLTLDSLLMQIK